jgi:hypothetical protein
MHGAIILVLKVLALGVAMFVCYAVAAPASGVGSPTMAPADALAAAGALLAVCVLNAAVVSYIVLRSRWTGGRLMAAIFVVFFGAATVMSQIESAVFLTALPPGTVPRLFLMGALVAAPFAVIAVLILGRLRGDVDATSAPRHALPPSEWTWKLAVIAVVYVVLYFTFGYFVAWQSPEVREYYGGAMEGSFVAQVSADIARRPSLLVVQVVRGLLWAGIGVIVIRMLKGSWKEAALALALLFAVVNTQLLLPNPYMPEAVRMAHLRETATSNFLFGGFVGWLLPRRFAKAKLMTADEARPA